MVLIPPGENSFGFPRVVRSGGLVTYLSDVDLGSCSGGRAVSRAGVVTPVDTLSFDAFILCEVFILEAASLKRGC